MPVKVVDASALGALIFAEPEGPEMVARLMGATLTAPALLPFEMASICIRKAQRHPEQRDMLLAALDVFRRMEIPAVGVDVRDVVRLAEDTGLTAYDASYLWLARLLNAELVTLDPDLAEAAARA
jgi:predicted nucleic acid-binding protein